MHAVRVWLIKALSSLLRAASQDPIACYYCEEAILPREKSSFLVQISWVAIALLRSVLGILGSERLRSPEKSLLAFTTVRDTCLIGIFSIVFTCS